MKVLLTGSTGYIGRRLKQKLLEDKNIKHIVNIIYKFFGI